MLLLVGTRILESLAGLSTRFYAFSCKIGALERNTHWFLLLSLDNDVS